MAEKQALTTRADLNRLSTEIGSAEMLRQTNSTREYYCSKKKLVGQTMNVRLQFVLGKSDDADEQQGQSGECDQCGSCEPRAFREGFTRF
jgi:hypothetical protein